LGTPETRIQAVTEWWIGAEDGGGVRTGFIEHEKQYKHWQQKSTVARKCDSDFFSQYSDSTRRHATDLKRVRKYVLEEAKLQLENVTPGLDVYDGSPDHKIRMLAAAKLLDGERLAKGKNGVPQNMKAWCDERAEHRRPNSDRKGSAIAKSGRASQGAASSSLPTSTAAASSSTLT
jgi:hypothetical protein